MLLTSSQQLSYNFALDYKFHKVGSALIIHADCLEWLGEIPANSLSAVVTDPPYGVKEYDFDQLEKRENGSGGVWRIPPSFDGSTRTPQPRFTDLRASERKQIYRFFQEWAGLCVLALKPGAHLFVACNSFLAPLVYDAIVAGGLEFRDQIIRNDVMTLRGGDRPKNAELQFPDVCTLPRGCYEPWGLFRKPLPKGMKVSECLYEHGTGALRRLPDGRPFMNVIESRKTPTNERKIANHSSLKPQSFLRKIVYASLPLGQGIVCDPFMGSGSTVAAAEALGLQSIGVERRQDDFDESVRIVPELKALPDEDTQLSLFA